MGFAEGFIAGGFAGVVVEAALYPIDTIKTRLQACQVYCIFLCIYCIMLLTKFEEEEEQLLPRGLFHYMCWHGLDPALL